MPEDATVDLESLWAHAIDGLADSTVTPQQRAWLRTDPPARAARRHRAAGRAERVHQGRAGDPAAPDDHAALSEACWGGTSGSRVTGRAAAGRPPEAQPRTRNRARRGHPAGPAPGRRRSAVERPVPHPRRAGPAEPEVHLRDLRHRLVQPVRPRGRGRGRRGAGQGLQPAVHLRRLRAGQDPPAARDRALRASGCSRRCGCATCQLRGVHQRLHQLDPRRQAVRPSSGATATSTSCSSTTSSSWRARSGRRRSSSTRSTRCTTRTSRSSSPPTGRRSSSSTLEDRLRTRFEWGLITDVQPPDLETRIAILRKKAAQERLTAPPEVLEFIASEDPDATSASSRAR